MNVDIYIREVTGSSKREIRIPWLPEIINAETGEATMVSYDILNVGEVVMPTGVGLSIFSWESIFPGANRSDLGMLRGEKKNPSHYDDILKYWKKNGTKLHLMVTGYPINADVYLTNYTSKASGGFGDLEYSVTFKEAKDITVTSAKTSTKALPQTKRSTASNIETKYVVRKGDTLWSIAANRLGSGLKWSTIYSKNRTIIEQTAKEHGRSSSDNGHWIYPGTTLLLS